MSGVEAFLARRHPQVLAAAVAQRRRLDLNRRLMRRFEFDSDGRITGRWYSAQEVEALKAGDPRARADDRLYPRPPDPGDRITDLFEAIDRAAGGTR